MQAPDPSPGGGGACAFQGVKNSKSAGASGAGCSAGDSGGKSLKSSPEPPGRRRGGIPGVNPEVWSPRIAAAGGESLKFRWSLRGGRRGGPGINPAGNHINIHHNQVYACPNSGIRINKGDYCIIQNNLVFDNTWWSSNAECTGSQLLKS